eukprot:512067-Amphidinium_carterae.6
MAGAQHTANNWEGLNPCNELKVGRATCYRLRMDCAFSTCAATARMSSAPGRRTGNYGGQVNRPLSNVDVDVACGLETATDKKSDHVAIKLDFRLALVSQGYMCQKSYEEAKNTNVVDVAVAYQAWRDQLLAS